MDGWNPMREDFQDANFNSYIRGPGKNLPARGQGYTREGMKQVQLFIQGIPKDITNEGLESLFSRAGQVKRAKVMLSKIEHAGDTYGFVTMENLIAAEKAIALYNGFPIGDFVLSVSVSLSKEELEKKRQQKMDISLMSYGNHGDFSDADSDFGYTSQYERPNKMNGIKNKNTSALGSGRGQKLWEYAGVAPGGDADTTLTSRSRLNSLSIDVENGPESYLNSTAGRGSLIDQNTLLTPVGRGLSQNPIPRQPGSYVKRDRPQEQQYNYGRGRGLQAYGGGYYQNRRGRGVGGGGYHNVYPGFGGYQPVMPMPVLMQPYAMPQMYVPEPKKVEQNNVSSPPVRQECSVCRRLGSSRCSRCKIPYCSQECQSEDWAQHKLICNKPNSSSDSSKTMEGFDVTFDDDLIPKVKHLMEKATGNKFSITRKEDASSQSSLTSDDDKPSKKKGRRQADRASKDSDDCSVERRNVENSKRSESRRQDRGSTNKKSDVRDQRRANDGNKARSSAAAARGCYNCGDMTHMKMDCPVANNQKCYNCQQIGHISRECPKKKENVLSSGSLSSRSSVSNDDKNEEPVKSSTKPVTSSTPKDDKKSPPRKNLPVECMPLNKDIKVVLCEVIDPGHFYLQINQAEYTNPFKDLMGDILERYYMSEPDVKSVMVGEIYCVRFSLDKEWYRAKVLKVSGQEVLVQFLDFGNKETTSLDNIRHLADCLTRLPSQAILCALDGILPKTGDNWKLAATEVVKYLPTEKSMEAICKSTTDTSDGKLHFVDLKNEDGEDVAKKLISSGLVRSSCEPEMSSSLDSNRKLLEQVSVNKSESSVLMFCDMKRAQDDLEVGQEFPLGLSNVVSPNSFSIQIQELSHLEKFVAFNAKFNEECTSCTQTEYRPNCVGELVASLFSQDNGWYRARVLELVQTGAVVEYIDYLNSETVTFKMMRKPTVTIMQFPAQGIPCSYYGLVEPTSGKWPEDVMALYLQMSQFQLTGIVRTISADNVSIELKVVGESVTEALNDFMTQDTTATSPKQPASESKVEPTVEHNMKDPTAKTGSDTKLTDLGVKKGQIPAGDLPMDGIKMRAIVSCVSAIDGVYVQDLNPVVEKRLSEMMLSLNQTVKPIESFKPSVGDSVAAVFAVNGNPLWHRGHVVAEESEDSFMVVLVDFGNTVCVKSSDIAPLDSEFLVQPAFAVQCQLAGTENSSHCDLSKLQTLTDHEVFVQAVNYVNGIFFIVLNLGDGTNINEAFESLAAEVSSKSPKSVSSSVTSSVSVATKSSRQFLLPLTPFPCDKNEVKVKIVYIVNLAKFYVHLCDPEIDAKLLECLKDMQAEYAEDEVPYSAEVGEYVAVYYDDGSGALWYRGKVLPTNDAVDKVNVAVVDYGNEGLVAKQHIRRLADKFTELPVVAIECRMVGSTGEETKEMIEQFRCLETDTDDIDVEVVTKHGNMYLVDIILRDPLKTKVSEFLELDKSVTQSLDLEQTDEDPDTTKTGSPVSASVASSASNSTKTIVNGLDSYSLNSHIGVSPENSTLPLNTDVSAVTFVIESIKSFFIQMADEETQQSLASLMVQLAEYCSGTSSAYTPSAGEIVAALFVDGDDATWYRGEVIEVVDSKQAKVLFLDYGNTEDVLFKDIRRIEARFLSVPKIAIHCRLSGSGVETEEMLQKFQTISNVPMTVCARSYRNGLYEVDVMTPDGRNLSSDLGLIPDFTSSQNNSPSTAIVDNLPKQVSPKSDPLPQKVSSPPKGEKKSVFTQTLKKSRPDGDSFKAVITSVINPNDFHCQIFAEGEHSNLQQELKFLSDTMKLECDVGEDEMFDLTFEVGELCCAKYPVDNCWYRATVLEIFADKTVKVEYVDFGNCADVPVSLLRPVTMDYTRLPVQAFRCSLNGIRPAGTVWTEPALMEMVKFQDRKLDAKVISVENDVYMIELIDEEQNIVITEHLISAGLAKTSDTEEISEMEKLKRENEVMRRQMEALQAKLAGTK